MDPIPLQAQQELTNSSTAGHSFDLFFLFLSMFSLPGSTCCWCWSDGRTEVPEGKPETASENTKRQSLL